MLNEGTATPPGRISSFGGLKVEPNGHSVAFLSAEGWVGAFVFFLSLFSLNFPVLRVPGTLLPLINRLFGVVPFFFFFSLNHGGFVGLMYELTGICVSLCVHSFFYILWEIS